MDFRKHGINNRSYQILNEHIDKETITRLKWKEKFSQIEKDPTHNEFSWRFNFEKIENEPSLTPVTKDTYKPPVIKIPPKGNLNLLSDEEINDYLIKLGVKNPETYQLRINEMFEADPTEKDLIYDGVSLEQEGRYKNLEVRRKYKPENKYPFPVTSSMNYGWNMYDNNKV